MKRFHIHVSIDDINKSIKFYSDLFGAEPTKRKNDYAKWMLDDPRVNFSISTRGAKPGVDHLGIQIKSSRSSSVLRSQLVLDSPSDHEPLDLAGALVDLGDSSVADMSFGVVLFDVPVTTVNLQRLVTDASAHLRRV